MTRSNAKIALYLIGWAGFQCATALAQKAPPARDLAHDFDIRGELTRSAAAQPQAAAGFSRQQRAVVPRSSAARPPRSMSRAGGALAPASTDVPENIARSFLRANRQAFRFNDTEVAALRLVRTERAGAARILRFNQTLNGIDVFEGQVRVAIDGQGRVVEAGADAVVPGLNISTAPALTAEQAARAACRLVKVDVPAPLRAAARALPGWALYENPRGPGFSPIAVAPSIFPMDAQSAVRAYRLLVEVDSLHWYEILLDGSTGRLLLRHNLYNQAASATVWRKSPLDGTRAQVEFPTGWLPEGGTVTTGNNADAYLDTNADNRPDSGKAPGISGGRAASETQMFDFPTGDRLTLQSPLGFKAAAVTNLFYFVNLAHDYYYSLGFDEGSGNFQADNFGRGGEEGDAVLAQAQDGAMSNNANFATPPDGMSPRLRVGVFTYGSSNPANYTDADYDGGVIFHEYAHGVSRRLLGAGTTTSCLNGTQSGALGEGWSDYFAASYFNDPVMGAYVTLDPLKGIRRNSYERYPYTYEDLGNHGFEVHNDGEIWAATLWDMRSTLGTEATDRLVANGLRFTPCASSMPEARDAILTADDTINGGANRAGLWTVFARHGLGFAASGYDGYWKQGAVFTAAYDLPPDLQPGNRPPVTQSGVVANPSMGTEFVYQIAAEDPDGGTLHYELVSGPSGMTVHPDTGEVRWNPSFTADQARIAITDGQGGRVLHGLVLPVVTDLSPGEALRIDGAEGSSGLATINVPPGVPVLQITLRGQGDADLYLYDPDIIPQAYSQRVGGTETVSIPEPAAGQWLIAINGYRRFWDVDLTASMPVPRVLTLPASLCGLAGDTTSETFFQINVPKGEPSVRVETSGGTGDVDILVRRGSVPTCSPFDDVLGPCEYDDFSANEGNEESVVIDTPDAAVYYINLAGGDAYDGVTLSTTGAPALSVGPSEMNFAAFAGGGPPPAQTALVKEVAGGVLAWRADTYGGNWLKATPVSGTTPEAISVSADPAGLSEGTYWAVVYITSDGAPGSYATILVKLTVEPGT